MEIVMARWTGWWSKWFGNAASKRRPIRRSTPLRVEQLEDRFAPAIIGAPIDALDAPMLVVVNDVQVLEGNSGLTAATFTVSLSHAANEAIFVFFNTSDGTATGANTGPDADY